MSRETISELQEQAVKLNLSDRVAELEKLRIELARAGADSHRYGGRIARCTA